MPSGKDDSSKLKTKRGIAEGVDGFEDFASEISVHDTKSLLDSDSSCILLDCREPKEHEFAHIEGSVLIPMDELADRIDELEEHRDSHIIVYCHHGGRSLQVVNWLRNHGFSKAQNLTGGIDFWSQEIDPMIPRY